jgi:hypothetical protein
MPTTGRLAYLKNDAAWVEPVGNGTAAAAPAVRLPRSEDAERVFLSPVHGAALVFTAGKGGARGVLVPPPFREARPLPAPLGVRVIPDVIWSGDGRVAFCSVQDLVGAFRPATNNWQRLPFPAVHSAARDGAVVTWATEETIGVGWPETGRYRTLFSARSPDPLLRALRLAKRPERVRGLADTDPALFKDPMQWRLGSPALAPDGKTAFFAANAGGGAGASGNTLFAFFAADVATGRLSVLSRLGTFEGRVPFGAGVCRVSPDGGRLLFVTSLHNMAVDNPTSVFVVDLLTQAARELVGRAPHRKDNTNLVDGVAWSPDGRFVAASVLFYDVAAVLRQDGWEPRPDAYTLFVFDAATGRVVRRIAGARRPAWSG